MSVDLEWELEGPPPPSPPPAPDPTVVEDYEQALVQLLPRGDAWNFDPEGVERKLLRGLAVEPARVEDRLRQLLREIDPRTATELLEDWERVLGLPEKCGTPPTSLDARRLAAFTKLTRRPSGNVPFFLQLAADLGYPKAEIRRLYDPPACNGPCNQGLYDHEGFWSTAWAMLPWGTTENDGTLQCLVRKYAQAHEIVVFPEMPLLQGLVFAPDLRTLYDPISGLQGVADGTTYDAATDSRVFNGSTDRVDWPSVRNVNGEPVTLALWCYMDAHNDHAQRPVMIAASGGVSDGLYTSIEANGRALLVDRNDGGDSAIYQAEARTWVGQWVHVAFTYTGSNDPADMQVFYNGVLAATADTTTGAGIPREKDGFWSLGGSPSADTVNFDGRITGAAGWSRVLTADEIAWLAGPGRILFGPWRPIP